MQGLTQLKLGPVWVYIIWIVSLAESSSVNLEILNKTCLRNGLGPNIDSYMYASDTVKVQFIILQCKRNINTTLSLIHYC